MTAGTIAVPPTGDDPNASAGAKGQGMTLGVPLRRRYLYALSSGFLVPVTGFAQAILLPLLAYPKFGAESFGLWVTILSFVNLLALLDFGIGHAALNAVGSAHGAAKTRRIEGVATVSLVLSALGALSVLAGAAVLAGFVDPKLLFRGISAEAERQLHAMLLIFVILFPFSFPINVAAKLLLGLQAGYLPNLCRSAGNVLSIAAVWAALEAGLPMWAAFGLSFAIQIASGLPTIWACRHLFRWRIARRVRSLRPLAARLANQGGYFFLFQLAITVAAHFDYLILSSVIGPAAAAQYAILARMFQAVNVFGLVVNSQLWPVYAYLVGQGRKEVRDRVALIAIGGTYLTCAAMSLAIALASGPLLHWWLGAKAPDYGAALPLYAVFIVLDTGGTALGFYLYGAGKVREQALAAVLYAAASVTLKLLVMSDYGLTGFVAAALAAYAMMMAALALLLMMNRRPAAS